MDALDLTCSDIGCWRGLLELCTEDDGEPTFAMASAADLYSFAKAAAPQMSPSPRAAGHDLLHIATDKRHFHPLFIEGATEEDVKGLRALAFLDAYIHLFQHIG